MSEMTATRKAITLIGAVVLWLVAARLLWETQVPADLRVPETARDAVADAAAKEARTYARVLRALWLGGALAQLAALAALAAAAPRLARRARGRPLARSLQLLVVALAAGWLARLPFRGAAHWWRRRHDLSRQPYPEWLLDPWLELLAFALAACVALAVAVLLARRLGGRWWVAGVPLFAALGMTVVVLHPLVLAPRLEPLADRALAAEIGRIAARLDAGEPPVEVRDASERTRAFNAEVAGIGPTRRVVLWDTALDGRLTRAQVRFLAAHELAHVARRHLWKGLGWFALLSPLLVYGVAVAARRRGGIAEPGAVPAAALALVALELALLPFVNVISRRYEREADWVALQVTRDAHAPVGLFRALTAENLADPDPPRWAFVLLATHPSIEQRIGLARAWAARQR